MTRWFIFFKERTPFASYLIMCLGPVFSSFYLSKLSFNLQYIFIFLGLFLFFIVLRMMDEFKDFHKDQIAHPSRPLPRGLIDLKEFEMAVFIGLSAMIVFSFMILLNNIKSSFFYFLVIVHLWLMYKEFYLGKWLNEKPLLYAVTHQLILVTLCLFSLFTADSNRELSQFDWAFCFSVLISFFSYEISRKLDPSSHLVLKTYLQIYGKNGVVTIVFLLNFLLLLIFLFLKIKITFFIPSFFLIICLFLWRFNYMKFKMFELIATLNLIYGLYSGVFYGLTDK